MLDNNFLIAFAALVFSLVSLWANHKIGDRKRVKQLQQEVNEFQKQFEKATREKDEKELQRLKNIEPEIMRKMQDMLLLPVKSMVVILPLFFILIAAVESFFRGFTILLPFDLHVSQVLAFKIFDPAVYGPRGFFIVCSIFFNLLLELVYSNVIPKLTGKK